MGYYMTHQSNKSRDLPVQVADAIATLGERVRIARKRRRLTMEEMAARMFVTRKTLARVEAGEPGVTLAVLASALWVLGLDRDLLEMAVPERDKAGIFREQQQLPQRVRNATKPAKLDF